MLVPCFVVSAEKMQTTSFSSRQTPPPLEKGVRRWALVLPGFCGHDGLGQRTAPLIQSVLLVWKAFCSMDMESPCRQCQRLLAGGLVSLDASAPVHPAEGTHRPLQSVYPLSQLYEMNLGWSCVSALVQSTNPSLIHPTCLVFRGGTFT